MVLTCSRVGVLRKKNQLKNDNLNLKKENADLRERLRLLEEELARQQVDSEIRIKSNCTVVTIDRCKNVWCALLLT